MKTSFRNRFNVIVKKFFSRPLLLFICLVLTNKAAAQVPRHAWTKYSDSLTHNYQSITTDRSQNVCVTRSINTVLPTASNGTSILTIKYNPSGSEIWSRRYYAPETFQNFPVEIVTDAVGNIYVLGFNTLLTDNSRHVVLLKYSPSGLLLWDESYSNDDHDDYVPQAMALDERTGDIVIVGYSALSEGGNPLADDEIFIAKYSPTGGDPIYTNRYNRSVYSDAPVDLVIDALGNACVTGFTAHEYSYRGERVTSDITTIQYSPELEESWVRHFNSGGAVSTDDRPSDIDLDEAGNVYVVGRSSSAGSLIKYTPGGIEDWVIPHPDGNWDFQLEVYDANNIYITFRYLEEGIDNNSFKLVKYNSGGIPFQWEETYVHPEEGARIDIISMTLDRTGSIYVGISSLNDVDPEEEFYRVIRFNPLGHFTWQVSSSDSYNFTDLHVDDHFNIYAAGWIEGEEALPKGFVSKYIQPIVGLIPGELARFDRFDFSIWATERGWCWNEIVIDWTLYPICFLCPDPEFRASLNYNGKDTWLKEFNKPLQIALPGDKDFKVFSLEQKAGKNFQEVIVLDDNLVKNGITALRIATDPDKNIVNIKASTENGKIVPFSLMLLDKDGKSIWQQQFSAPLDKELSEVIKETGSTLKFSAVIEAINFKYYPNPFTESITVTIDHTLKLPAELSVFSMQGEKIMSQQITTGGDFLMKLNNQKTGLYILILKSGKNEKRELIQLK